MCNIRHGRISGPVACNRQAGFTLLEVLMVVVIVGVMAGLTVMTIGGQSEREFRRDVARIQQQLMLAQDEAQASGEELGLWVNAEGTAYGFYAFDSETFAWLPYHKDAFREQTLPQDYQLVPELLGEPLDLAELYKEAYKRNDKRADKDEEPVMPWLVFFSDGDYTPFRLWLSNPYVPDTVQVVEGDGLGEILVREADAADKPELPDD